MNVYLRALAAALLVAGCITIGNQYRVAEDYTVKVFVFNGDDKYVGFGSGYYVSPNVIMTARHVLDGGTSYSVMKKSWWMPKEASRINLSTTEDLAALCVKNKSYYYASLSEHSTNIEGQYYGLGNSQRRDFDSFSCTVLGFWPRPPRHLCMRQGDGRLMGFSGGPLFDDTGLVYGSITAQTSDKNDLDKNVVAYILPVELIQEAVQEAVKSCKEEGN